jgi:hypothetical protein
VARTIGVIVYNSCCHLVCGEISFTFETRYSTEMRAPIKLAKGNYARSPVPKWVDELLRESKIQGKQYGIDSQIVISIVRTLERLSQASGIGPATWITGTEHRVAA